MLLSKRLRSTVEDSIDVRQDCVGHGVGKMLLAELISVCQAKAITLWLPASAERMPPPVALHTSLGFQRSVAA